jgi:tetratricopeptide (TPR) repeat protein
VRYSFIMPPAAAGPVTITATVKYRRFDQHFIDFGMGKPHYEQPIVAMASQTRVIQAGDNQPVSPEPTENKEWMRWNNFGIALLDDQQYAASARAFERVAKLRPDYADAYTNIAIAQIQWQRYDEARLNLEKALTLAPGNARSLYYRALVERNLGNMDLAIADLQKVAISFPQSRDAHRELGFSYYQLHKYDLARAEYEKVQSIDPDDLSAHYILSIVYRRLGLMDLSTRQAAIFADQKDDPTASTYAYEFLQKHTEIANEGTFWHTHELDMPQKPGKHPLQIIAPSSASMSGGAF